MSRGYPTLDRRQLLRMFGVVAAAGATGGLAAACGADELTDGLGRQPSGLTVRVGLVVPNYGPFDRIGQDMRTGFELYLRGTGDFFGNHKVDLQIVDEGESPESALAAVNQLLDSGVVAVAGVANPDALQVISAVVQERRVPLVCTNTAPPPIGNSLFVWRTSSDLGEAGQALASYALRQGRTAYVMRADTSTGRAEAEQFTTYFQDLGGTVVNDQPGSSTPSSIEDQLRDARNRGVSLIFVSYAGAEAIQVLKAYHLHRAEGLQARMLGTGSLTETINLVEIGPLPQQVYTSMFYATDLDNDANRRFVTDYHRQHDESPSAYAMSAYDAAAVLDRAFALVPTDPTGALVNQAFSSLGQIESPRGIWTFNQNRSPQQKWYLRRLALDGQVPANLLDADLVVLG